MSAARQEHGTSAPLAEMGIEPRVIFQRISRARAGGIYRVVTREDGLCFSYLLSRQTIEGDSYRGRENSYTRPGMSSGGVGNGGGTGGAGPMSVIA
jgi:hypothetical protein